MVPSVCTSERGDNEEGYSATKDNVRATPSVRTGRPSKREPQPGLLRGSYASHGRRAVALATTYHWISAPALTADEKG